MDILLLVVIGVFVGFLNVLAGGGSLITMPILIFLGLPSAVANGTNRIALFIQNITAVTSFKKKGFSDFKLGIIFSIPAIIGAFIGSNIAISLSDEVFNKLLGIVMIIVLLLILFKPQNKLNIELKELGKKEIIIGIIAFFFVGIYGGLIQGGVGFIIIAALTYITGFSLVRINSLKVFIVFIYMISSLFVFIVNGKIHLMYGLSLGVGNSIGAYLGSNFAVKKGDKWIKIILSTAMIMIASKLLGILKI